MPSGNKLSILQSGVVIPAVPLALDESRRFDERHQRALLRYYAKAGAGGVAVAVHTTQFEIREKKHGLLKPVLELASSEIRSAARPLFAVAGVCGQTPQAIAEATLARELEYDAVLLSLGALAHASEAELISHCEAVAEIMPLIGFYLQPAVGGRVLPFEFWRCFAEIPNVVAIKIAPFNRYQTLDVVRAVAIAGRENEITLYTGNDDNIIADLITPFRVGPPGNEKILRIRGGLLGQFSVWTSKAVQLLHEIHEVTDRSDSVPSQLLRRNAELTDANSVVFDAAHGFFGCIPGINEVLRRQGLLATAHCLDEALGLSPGQLEALDRINRDYPWLTDDEFVRQHLDEWLS
jgi:hypothetical protein